MQLRIVMHTAQQDCLDILHLKITLDTLQMRVCSGYSAIRVVLDTMHKRIFMDILDMKVRFTGHSAAQGCADHSTVHMSI